MILLCYLAAINIIAFIAFFIDKQRARHNAWRISEFSLMLLAALGGALGAWISMRTFRHKTKHKKFTIGVPLLLVAQIIFFALLGGATYLLSYALTPNGRAERDAASITRLKEHYPGTAEWMDSLKRNGTLRDTFIVNRGRRLHAYYAEHQNSEGTAILVHGYTDNAIGMMMLGKLYHDTLHYNILLPEHEYHGKSEGEAIQMGWLDRINTERWIDIADSMWAGKPIYLHGISMGAATVMMCSGDSLPASVKGIIEDCGYTSVWDEFAGEIRNQFHLPPHPLMDIASALCKIRYGWDFREASAMHQVQRSTLPMLFIHGDADTFVPYSMQAPLYEAKQHGYKQKWVAPGTVHAMAYHDYPQEYRKQVETFIKSTKK